MRKSSIKNIVNESRLMKSVVVAILVSVMVLSSFQSLSAEPSKVKNNSELKEDVKNPERGSIYYVPDDFPNIQAAIDSQNVYDDDVIVVKPGPPYQGDGNRDLDFHGKSITVRSTAGYEDGNPNGSEGFWTTVESTIINCQGNAGDPHRGFIFHNGENADAKVRGLKIINAVSPNAASHYWTVNTKYGGGGAIACINSNPTIEYNILENNQAYLCGSVDVFCGGGAILSISSSPTISHNIMQNNLALAPYENIQGLTFGGGIFCVYHDWDNHNPIIENNTIINNIAVDESDNYNFGCGGGIACYYYSSPIIRYNHIEGNKAGEESSRQHEQRESRACYVWGYSAGGGIYLNFACGPIITHNLIMNNEAIAISRRGCWGDGVCAYGGGVYSQSDYIAYQTVFTYNDVIGNKAFSNYIDDSLTGSSMATGGGYYGNAKGVPINAPMLDRDTFYCNTFIENYAIAQAAGNHACSTIAFGGGISFDNCNCYNLYAHNNIISYNKAIASSNTNPDTSSIAYGGGICVSASTVAIYTSDIIANEAVVPHHGTDRVVAYGGGIAGPNLHVDRCRILNNSVRVEQQSDATGIGPFISPLNKCIPACGGGIAVTPNTGGTDYITNCIIAGNIARADNQTDSVDYKALGGGVAIKGYTNQNFPQFGFDTIVGNEVHTTNLAGDDIQRAYGGGIGFCGIDSFTHHYITNTIIWDNSADTTPNHGSQMAALIDSSKFILVRHCDVEDGDQGVYPSNLFKWGPPGQETWYGDGNINADPQFVDPDGPDNNPTSWEDNDYHLQLSSPCIDAGSKEYELVPQDYLMDYNHNENDDEMIPYDFDTGDRYSYPQVDIGADEWGSEYNILPPSIFDGPTKGIKGVTYTYKTLSYQSDLPDDLFFKFFWGDGSESDWIGPCQPFETVSASHSWVDSEIENTIKVKVRLYINGPESESELTVRMYKIGDTNADNQLDFGDINPFVLMQTNPSQWYTQYGGIGYWYTGDINMDGVVDFGDINPFVALFSGG